MTRLNAVLLSWILLIPSVRAGDNPAIGDLAGGRLGIPCGFGFGNPTFTSMRIDLKEASLVVAGTLSNARANQVLNGKEIGTDLKVEAILKAHPLVKDAKLIPLHRLVPIENPKKPPRMLIFFDVHKGKLDAYRGLPLKSDAPIRYIQEFHRLDVTKPREAVLFYLSHLHSADDDVSRDAHIELSNLPYSDLRGVVPRLSADALAGRVAKADPLKERQELTAFLMGHTGEARHAPLILQCLIESRDLGRQGGSGLMIGYTLLKPKEGLTLLRSITKDPKLPFWHRYAALRALRFFWVHRRDVLPRIAVMNAVANLLEHDETADLAIEEFRRQREPIFLDRILDLHDRKGFDLPIIRRTLLRYALTFPQAERAARFVERERAKDPNRVRDVEELLKQESALK